MIVSLIGRAVRALPAVKGKGALVRFVLAPLLRRRGLECVVPLRAPGGGVLRCRLDDWIPWNVFAYGRYHFERTFEAFMLRALQPGDVVLDVGANVGYYTVQFARLGAGAVHAFEPLEYQHARLVDNVALNDLENVEVHKLIVSDREATQPIYFAGPHDTGTSSLEVARGQAEEVASTRLDVFCAAHGLDRIGLVKVDVEGHEMKVLRGMERLLREGRVRDLFVELNRETLARAGETPEGACAYLGAFGYRAASIRTGEAAPYHGESESLVYFRRA